MNINEFIEELNKININLTSEQLNKLKDYASFLLEYNKSVNLTAIRDEKGIYLKHFYDSILVCKYYDFSKINSLIDVGSGAGFPGVVLKIIYPHINLTILDSNNKKMTFVRKLVEKLNLTNVDVVTDRAESFVNLNRHKFDVSIARAVSELRIISELCLPLTKIKGNFIAMKANVTDEVKSINGVLEKLNSKILNIYETHLPIEESNRSFVIFEVENEINNKYPRPYDQIIKKELK